MYLMSKMLSFRVFLVKKITYIHYLKFLIFAGMFTFIYVRKVLSDELTKLASLLNQMWVKQSTTDTSPAPVFSSFQ